MNIAATNAMTGLEPLIGELIYGCFHLTACGVVTSVEQTPAIDDCGRCFHVRENWHSRQVRVRREANGHLYEVEVRNA